MQLTILKVKQRLAYLLPGMFAISFLFAVPVYATDSETTPKMSDLLSSFTTVAAWFWKEIGLLLAWILNQLICYLQCLCLLGLLCPFLSVYFIVCRRCVL